MAENDKQQPRWEFLSGRSDWDGLGQFLLTGGYMPALVLVLIPFLVLGKLATGSPRQFATTAVILAVVGFFLFSVAKFSLFRQGHWLTVGSSLMTRKNRILYNIGYFLMICSSLMSVALIFANKAMRH